MKAIGKYTWIAYTSLRSSLAYWGEIAARTIFMAMILYIFMRLWTAVYEGVGRDRLGGLSLKQMLWYLMITEAIVLSSPRVSVEVDEDVRTGRLAVQLLRPLSYTLFLMAKTFGERAVRFTMNIVSGSIVTLVLVGPIPMSLSGLAMFALIVPVAFALDFLAYLFIGLFAFWLESTAGLWILYSRLTMLLGGMLMPIEIFPDRLQPVLRNLPFAMMVYGPARIFVAPSARTLLSIAVSQMWGLAAFSIAVYVIQSIALRRIQSNGG